jgi:membrane-associated phospholipid phosphatase
MGVAGTEKGEGRRENRWGGGGPFSLLSSPFSDVLLPVDRLLLVYLSLITVVAIVRAPRQPDCWWLLPAHGLFLLLLFLLRRKPLGPAGQALGEIYPLLLLVGFYSEVGILNGHGASIHDGLVQRWETALFGVELSRVWWQAMPSRVLSTVLHAAYFSYYLIVTVPALIFLRRRQTVELRNVVFTVIATFVVCYLAFVIFPVAGPYYLFPRPSAWFIDNLPARLVYATLAAGSSYGAAFPSSHVAAAVAATVSSFRGNRALGLAMVIPTILLSVGVVYCQMHYGVDAVAGAVVGGVIGWGVKEK